MTKFSLSITDAVILNEMLKDERYKKMFDDLVKNCVEVGLDDDEVRSLLFPDFARGLVAAYKEKVA